jgi:hypothetical protein
MCGRRQRIRVAVLAAALAVGGGTARVQAQLPVEIRFPELVVYSNTVSETVSALVATNFWQIHTQLLVRLSRDTRLLNDRVTAGMYKCRAAIPLVSDGVALADLADAANDDLVLRDQAFFHTELLWANRFVGYEELQTNAIYWLHRALAASYANLPALDSRLTALHGVTIPPFFLLRFSGPESAGSGEVVELVAELTNVGDLPAENMTYRMINLDDYSVPKPAPIRTRDLPAGTSRTHSFFARMPGNGLDAQFSFTVLADRAQAASQVHFIKNSD